MRLISSLLPSFTKVSISPSYPEMAPGKGLKAQQVLITASAMHYASKAGSMRSMELETSS